VKTLTPPGPTSSPMTISATTNAPISDRPPLGERCDQSPVIDWLSPTPPQVELPSIGVMDEGAPTCLDIDTRHDRDAQLPCERVSDRADELSCSGQPDGRNLTHSAPARPPTALDPPGSRLDDQPDDLALVVDAYRHGASVTSIADELDVSFDSVARVVIAHAIIRDTPLGGSPAHDTPTELDDPDWLRASLETGRTVGGIARRVAMSEASVAAALARHGFTVASSDGDRDVEIERSELVEQFRNGAERLHLAEASLDQAKAIQASAVARLAGSGLTVAAIADRLDLDDAAVDALLDERPPPSP
jgi:hypothetical protein